MKRNAENYLNYWFQQKIRHPLIIRGARQVGKSTLVRLFAKNKSIDLVEINLEIDKVPEFDKNDGFDIQKAIRQIESLTGKRITVDSLIFIDEVQEQPQTIKWLRYFFEKRSEIAVIAAGSLLEIILKDIKLEFPVGRIDYFHLGPMTFSEFMEAKKGKLTSEMLFDVAKENKISERFHNNFMEDLKEFYFVGGMPEAVKQFIDNGPLEARNTHRRIVSTYQQDLRKYAKNKNIEKALLSIFNMLPNFIGKKTPLSKLAKERSIYIKEALELLILSRVVLKSIHTNATGIPLKAGENDDIFTLFFLDCGLMNYLLRLNFNDIISIPNNKNISIGNIAEQFVAQHLAYRELGIEEPNLNFFIRDKKAHKAQIDFIIQLSDTILPIEVKAGKTGVLRSLLLFLYEKKINKGIRLDGKYRSNLVNTEKRMVMAGGSKSYLEFKLLNLPLYQVELFSKHKLIKELLR